MPSSRSPRSAAPSVASSATLIDLERLADALGVHVATASLEPGYLGLYDADHHAISLTLGLTPVERRCVLAHELGHAVHRHRTGSPSNERVANAFAARLLVDPEALRHATMWTHEPWELAEELDLTEDVVRDYLTLVAPAVRM